MEKRNLDGWLPDKIDNRDYLFRNYRLSSGEFPRQIDLRGHASPIFDQGTIGSCTACALCALVEYIELFDNAVFEKLSELFLYYIEREANGNVRKDEGSSLRTGIKCLAKQGCCSAEKWPYKVKKFKTKPSKRSYTDAENHQILNYFRLLNLTDCKQCLVDSFPFGAGIAIYESFDSVGQDGIVPYPKKSEKLRGYHAISFFGYDEDEQVFICKNSWGTGFGDNGWFYLPYKFVENPRLCSDLWTIRKVENY